MAKLDKKITKNTLDEKITKNILGGKTQEYWEGKIEAKPTFGEYAKASAVAKLIFESYSKKIDEKSKEFYVSDNNRISGYLSNLYGNVGLLSLVNRMGYNPRNSGIDFQSNLKIILDYINKNGYTLYPYLSEDENRDYFGKNKPYIGAMTWALSYFVSFRRACKEGKIILTGNEEEKDALDKAIAEQVKIIITTFNSSVIRNEEDSAIGWGFTTGCEKASLFFTYSVLEAFSDFEDNVMKICEVQNDADGLVIDQQEAADQTLLDKINSINGGGTPIQEEWRSLCQEVAFNVWKAYGSAIRDNFVDDTFPKGFKIITRDDILKSNSSNALFNSVFVVFIMFYGYANAQDGVNPDEVLLTMTSALQNVQRTYMQFKNEGLEYLVDTYIIPFKSKVDKDDRYIKFLNNKELIDTTITPVLVKANNLIAYHIQKYPMQQMGELFLDIWGKVDKDEWIWETQKYDVKITEKYIEAVADFYAYYTKYEAPCLTNYKAYDKRSEAYKKELDERVQTKADQMKEAAKVEIRKEIEETIRDEYKIENAINAQIESKCQEVILDALDKIVGDLKEEKEFKLEKDSFEYDLKTKLSNLFVNAILSHGNMQNCGEDMKKELPKRVESDFAEFARLWVEGLAKTPVNSRETALVISDLLNNKKTGGDFI